MDAADIWEEVAALDTLATPSLVDALEATWTTETTPSALYGVMPSLIVHIGHLIQHLPLPAYVVMANRVTLAHTWDRMTLQWKGFATDPPTGMGSRQPVEAITTLESPAPYCWEFTWQFREGRLQMVAIQSTDPDFHIQQIMSWNVLHTPVTIRTAWSADGLDDLCLESADTVYWLSRSYLSFFRQMLNTRHYWLNTSRRRRLRAHVMNGYTHGWLERLRLAFPAVLVSTGIGWVVSISLPSSFHCVTDAIIVGIPLLVWSVSYLLMRAHADRRLRSNPRKNVSGRQCGR